MGALSWATGTMLLRARGLTGRGSEVNGRTGVGSLRKLRGKFEATGLLCKFKLVLWSPGQCQAGVRRVWSDGWR